MINESVNISSKDKKRLNKKFKNERIPSTSTRYTTRQPRAEGEGGLDFFETPFNIQFFRLKYIYIIYKI
jgi:hypothetical protein